MAINTWTVVNFEKDDTVEAVPTKWLSKNEEGTMCYWPPFTGETSTQAMKKCLQPQETWQLFKCRLFKHGTFDNYMHARTQARKAEITSDLSSTDTTRIGLKRKIKPVVRSSSSLSSSGDDEQDILPAPSLKCSKRLKVMDTVNSLAGETTPKTVVSPKILYTATESERNIYLCNTSNTVAHRTLGCSLAEPGRSAPVCSTPTSSRANTPIAMSQDVTFTTLSNNFIQNEACRCCHHQQQIIDCLNKIIRKQSIERGILTQLLADIAEIKTRLVNTSVIGEEESIFKTLKLPVTDANAMDDMEHYLMDEGAMKRAQIEVSRIGGNNPGDFIRRAISRIMDDLVCKEYNWEGKKGKKQFKNLKIAHLLLGSLAISQGIKEEYQGAQVIKNFIKNASERAKQRQNKM